LARFSRQVDHVQYVTDIAHRLRAVFLTRKQGATMRRVGPPSEIGRFATPLVRLFDAAWQRMHYWVAAMAIFYVLSGITVVKSDEVAVILRWGRLVGATPALQEHGPGLLFAFPRPIDRVVRVQVKHVWEVPVRTLASTGEGASSSLDPVTQG